MQGGTNDFLRKFVTPVMPHRTRCDAHSCRRASDGGMVGVDGGFPRAVPFDADAAELQRQNPTEDGDWDPDDDFSDFDAVDASNVI